jgi:hypothetical protein
MSFHYELVSPEPAPEPEHKYTDVEIKSFGRFELEEEVNMEILRIIRDNATEVFTRLGNKTKHFCPSKNNDVYTTDVKVFQKQIEELFVSKTKSKLVKYHYASKSNFGRRFRRTPSLQELCRPIRHAIAESLYYDIDIKNTAPTVTHQLAEAMEFDHPILKEYVENRDAFLDSLIDEEYPTKDDAKAFFLKVLNGGGNGKSGHEKMDQFYVQQQKFLSLVFGSERFKKYREKAQNSYEWAQAKYKEALASNPKEKPLKPWDNRRGSCFNSWLCDVEDMALCIIEKGLQSRDIKYGTLCFDGLLVYKKWYDDGKERELERRDLPNLMEELEAEIKQVIGLDLKLAVKEMKEAVDLSDLKTKTEIDDTDEAYAEYVIESMEGEFKYDNFQQKLYLYNHENALWEIRPFACIKPKLSKILIDYISTSPDQVQIYKEIKRVKSDRGQSSILRQIECRIMMRDDTDFIRSHMNMQSGLFPIAGNKVVNLRTAKVEDRVKEHYFTKTTNRHFLEEYDEEFCNNYYTQLLSTPKKVAREEHRDCLISSLAYIMSGDSGMKIFVNLIGKSGDNGKSVFLNLHGLVLDCFAITGNKRIFVEQENQAVHDSEMFSLIGQRMVTISEMSEGKRFNEEVIKNLTGGDRFSIRGAGKAETLDVRMNCVPVVVTNEVCRFRGPVFKERLFCVDFCNKFLRVTGFEESVLSKADHFFTHIVHYCKKYYDNGRTFEFSDEVKSFTQQIKDEADPYLAWSSEQDYFEVTNDQSHKVTKDEIYYNYTNFCKAHDFSPLGPTKFAEKFRLENKVECVKDSVGTSRQVYVGVKLV